MNDFLTNVNSTFIDYKHFRANQSLFTRMDIENFKMLEYYSYSTTQNYARLRFGVGAEFSKGKQIDYVLGKWSNDENKTLDDRIEQSINFIKGFCTIGLEKTMSAYNNK